MTQAEQDAMRRILAQRSSDLLPSKKGVVNLCEMAHFGLLVNYACIGFLNGLFPSLIYPFFKLYLNMESYQVSAALMVIQLPWSYKTVFGILSDHYPIFGYRRKSYILIGWLICFIALMVLAYSPHEDPYYASGEIHRTRNAAARIVDNPHAPEAGARYLIDIMFVCIGYVIADVACDGIMVELAQHEHIEVRGTAQSTIYIVRYSSNLVAGIVTALCFNGAEYGGSFSWSVSYHLVFYACGIITMLGAISTIFLLDEEPFPPDLLKHPFPEMWRIFKQRAIWQLMAFHFLNSFLSSFGFSGMASIQEYWAGIVPLNSSIASCVSTFLVVFATWLMRTYFLNASWRKMMLACSLFASAVNFSVNMIVTFDIERNEWFYLGGPQLAVVPDGMRHVISGFVTVEIAEHGFEGATYSLLTTVHNLATPCATSAYNFVDSFFDVTDADIASDTTHVRHQVAYCLLIALTAQLLGLATLKLLPKQKLEAQELKFHGGSSARAGLVALVVLLGALAWATTLNLLSIQSSTACLRIAGGRGC
uniref:Major facilitator superfamily associated domain-containing protein n=1 Tax=Globisporangium ultimum (strain ATCC 200006 / CBS 805.95 / DAOM BR144) TaxID=431595 RepID=K3WRL0_GLOUD